MELRRSRWRPGFHIYRRCSMVSITHRFRICRGWLTRRIPWPHLILMALLCMLSPVLTPAHADEPPTGVYSLTAPGKPVKRRHSHKPARVRGFYSLAMAECRADRRSSMIGHTSTAKSRGRRALANRSCCASFRADKIRHHGCSMQEWRRFPPSTPNRSDDHCADMVGSHLLG